MLAKLSCALPPAAWASPVAERDTPWMPEESTTPDLLELGRRVTDAISSGDFDLALSFYAPGAVWDMSPMGLGIYEDRAAIRAFFGDWRGSYEEYEITVEDERSLGDGVGFAVLFQNGRMAGSAGYVELCSAVVSEWTNGLITRTTTYGDIDEARAAAERLAESRG